MLNLDTLWRSSVRKEKGSYISYQVKKVIAGVDSKNDGEIKALVYVMGRKFDGYVLNGKTYVYQDGYRCRQFLNRFLGGVKLQDDELYLSVEEIAVIMNYADILSSWKTAIHQVFYDAPEIWYEKSSVIKQERKDAK